jgi:small-conductance mechanosensitive channel
MAIDILPNDALAAMTALFDKVSGVLNTIVVALVIALFGFIIGKTVEIILRSLFSRIQLDDRLTRLFGARRNYSRAIRRTVVRLIYVAAVVLALHELTLADEAIIIVVGIIVLIALANIIVAGVEILPNLLARRLLAAKHIAIGDDVAVHDTSGVITGTVIDMTLIDVRIKRKNGDVFFIPNRAFLRTMIKRGASTHVSASQQRPAHLGHGPRGPAHRG